MSQPQPQPQDNKNILIEYEKLVKFLQEQLKIKEAVCFDKRVRYFRTDDLAAVVEENSEAIQKILKSWTFENPIQGEKEVKKFVSDLLENKIIWKLERGPDDPKYKWPKRLYIARDQATPTDTAFYSFVITPRNKSVKIYTFLIIAAVAALCLFQLWPMTLKIGVFYTSVVLLYIMIGVIVVRLIVYVVFRILGFDVYIFPNLFEEVSFLDSFRPIISFDKCQDGVTAYLARAFGLVFLAYMMFRLSQEPDLINEYRDMGIQSFDDIISWGQLKLEGHVDIPGAGKDDFRKRIEDLLNAADEDEAQGEKKEDGDGEKSEVKEEEPKEQDSKVEEPKEIDDDYINKLIEKDAEDAKTGKRSAPKVEL